MINVILYSIPLLIAILYSMGGADGIRKSVRRFGVPLVSCGVMLLFGLWGKALLCWSLFPVLCLGYGESSWLRKLVGGSNLICRSIMGVLLTGCLYLITNNIFVLLYLGWYIGLTSFWKWDDFEILGLLVEEFLIGFGLGICVMIGAMVCS